MSSCGGVGLRKGYLLEKRLGPAGVVEADLFMRCALALYFIFNLHLEQIVT
jgi:hypothetical protein